MRTYLSFDVGLVNLAFVVATVNDDFTECMVHSAHCVDITNLPHRRVSRENCSLHHSREACDRIQHFIQEYCDCWEGRKIDKVFIERQPIQGLNHVESILFMLFRHLNATKISPNAMHKWLGISHLDYNGRKEATTKKALPYLRTLAGFSNANRQHDMADALMLMLFGAEQDRREDVRRTLEEQRLATIEKYAFDGSMTLNEWFDQFRYVKRRQLN